MSWTDLLVDMDVLFLMPALLVATFLAWRAACLGWRAASTVLRLGRTAHAIDRTGAAVALSHRT